MADFDLPVLRNDGTVEENLNDNAIYNVLPSRYTNEGEESTEVFERVAKNIAVAELVHVDDDLSVSTECVKPSHPRRQELLDDIGVSKGESFEITERTAKHLSYNAVMDTLRAEGPTEYADALEEVKKDFQNLMESLSFMPNSPTLMNAGDELQQLSACFVISPDDDIYDIHDTAREAAEVFQSGGGMGYGFWKLRPRGAEVGSTGGYASGPITFMRTFDQMCETIAQGGARRGAQMGVMKVDHPDVIEFIHAKRKDVSLAQSLRLNDPDDFTHNEFADALEEARDILADPPIPEYLRNAIEGHLSNFNISVGVTDEFMEAVENNEEFTLRDPQTGEPWVANEETAKLYEMFDLGEYVEEGEVLEIPANELWEHMLEGAYENGEPGVVHIDEFNRQHSFPVELDEPLQNQEHAQLATNPCVTGNTKVATADGRGAVPIEELVGEEDVQVFTRSDEDVEVALATNIRKTREDAELVRIETDGEAELTCTVDHPVWTRNRGWVEAQNLKSGDSLHMLYEQVQNAGYRNMTWTGSDAWNLEHRMVARDILDMDISGYDVHHENESKTDNRSENLELMDPAEHGRLEQKKRRDMSEHNPVNVLKERGEFQQYKDENPFYDTAGENNPMSGEREEIECLECGRTMKSVTNTHLESQHDMTTDEYKEKYDDPVMVKRKEASNHVVTSVESAGTEDVYDLEVPETHNFYASQEGGEYINIHNCGEQPLMEGEACNLGHINLSTLVSHDLHNWQEFQEFPKHSDKSLEEQIDAFLDTAINWSEFNWRINVGTQFLDNVVTMSNFPVPEIEETVRENRKIGLGIMGLAQLYVQLGIPYGSEAANEIARQLMTHINHKSKERSHQLAKQRGSFENWEDSKYANPDEYADWFEHHVGYEPEGEAGFKIRNHNTTTIAPTGTTSMIGDTSGGCEPIYSVVNYKNVSDDVQGDEMLVQYDSLFLRVLEENSINVEEMKEVAEAQMADNEFDGIESLDMVPDELAELFVTTSDLTAKEHARVQLACQEGVDSAISKTVNAPHDATLDDTREAFELVLQNGGKGVTYYRDGTRSKQVLTTRADNQETDDEEDKPETKSTAEIVREKVESDGLDNVLDEIGYTDETPAQSVDMGQTGTSDVSPSSGTRERPNTLVGQTYRIETGYGRMYVTVNDHEGRPFEVLATIGKSGGRVESMLEGLARMVSASLRSGIPVEEVIDQLRGIRAPDVGFDNGEQIQSIPDGIATALVRHTGKKPWLESQEAEPVPKNFERPDGGEVESQQSQSSGEPCPKCEKGSLIYTEGCKGCDTCNFSKC